MKEGVKHFWALPLRDVFEQHGRKQDISAATPLHSLQIRVNCSKIGEQTD